MIVRFKINVIVCYYLDLNEIITKFSLLLVAAAVEITLISHSFYYLWVVGLTQAFLQYIFTFV